MRSRKTITKTSLEAQIEKKAIDYDATCPECGHVALGGLSGCRHSGGFLFGKEVRYSSYSCRNCGCEWEIIED